MKKQKKYLESRKLNPNKFYYSEKFKSWVNSIQHTFSDLKYEEPRIVIPLLYNNKFVGLQGRSLNLKSIKYITIMLDDDAPKIYGLDEVQKTKRSTSWKAHLIPHSFAIQLLYVELMVILISGIYAIVFGYTITNLVMPRFTNESQNVLIMKRES